MPQLPLGPYQFPGDLFDNAARTTPGPECWWMFHARPRAEKALARQFLARRLTSFLPVYWPPPWKGVSVDRAAWASSAIPRALLKKMGSREDPELCSGEVVGRRNVTHRHGVCAVSSHRGISEGLYVVENLGPF